MRYAELLSYFRKELRSGNWHRLSYLEKGLYRAVLFYTRVKCEIVNSKLAAMVLSIIEKVTENTGFRILKAGRGEAKRMLSTYEGKGAFVWCPELKEWLREPDYILWLGLSALTGISHRTK